MTTDITTKTATFKIETGRMLPGAEFVDSWEYIEDEYGCKTRYEFVVINDYSLVEVESTEEGEAPSYRDAAEIVGCALEQLALTKPDYAVRFSLVEDGAWSFMSTGWLPTADAPRYVDSLR